jgi:hypothetical protein
VRHHLVGGVRQRGPPRACVAPQHLTRFIGAAGPDLRQGPFGLLDDDTALQRGLQLFGDNLAASDGSLLKEPDRRYVGEGLADPAVDGTSRRSEVEQSEPRHVADPRLRLRDDELALTGPARRKVSCRPSRTPGRQRRRYSPQSGG